MAADLHAHDLQPGDAFTVGGITRTVVATAEHADDTVSIHYRPGTGLIHVDPELRIRSVSRVAEILADLEAARQRDADWHNIRRHR